MSHLLEGALAIFQWGKLVFPKIQNHWARTLNTAESIETNCTGRALMFSFHLVKCDPMTFWTEIWIGIFFFLYSTSLLDTDGEKLAQLPERWHDWTEEQHGPKTCGASTLCNLIRCIKTNLVHLKEPAWSGKTRLLTVDPRERAPAAKTPQSKRQKCKDIQSLSYFYFIYAFMDLLRLEHWFGRIQHWFRTSLLLRRTWCL